MIYYPMVKFINGGKASSMHSVNKLALVFGNYNLLLLVDDRNNYLYSTVLCLKMLLGTPGWLSS